MTVPSPLILYCAYRTYMYSYVERQRSVAGHNRDEVLYTPCCFIHLSIQIPRAFTVDLHFLSDFTHLGRLPKEDSIFWLDSDINRSRGRVPSPGCRIPRTMAVSRHHVEGRMILLVGIFLAFLPEKSESTIYLVNRTCALNYRCPDVDGLKCRVYLLPRGCPIQTKDTDNLIPSDPKNVKVWKSSTKQDGDCRTGFTVGWIPPNDNGAETLEGFELRVTMMSEPFSGAENCIRFDFNGTEWTPDLIETEIPFQYECFNSPPLGEYNVRLQSLPKPKFEQTVSSHIDRTVTINGRECEPPTTLQPERHTPGNKVVVTFKDAQDKNESSDLKLPLWALSAVVGTFVGLVLTLTSVGIYKYYKRNQRGNSGLLNNSPNNPDWQNDLPDDWPSPSDVVSEPPFSVPPNMTCVSPLAIGGTSISTTKLYDADSCCGGHPYNPDQPQHPIPPINNGVQTSDLGDSIPTPTYASDEIVA